MNRIFIILLLIGSFYATEAKDGYEIKVSIEGFEQEELYLAYHYGDKQFIKDTTTVGQDGFFTFSGEESLDCGLYLIVLPPNNDIFQLLIDDDQHFEVKTTIDDMAGNMKIKDAKENETFYKYLQFLGEKSSRAKELRILKDSLEAGSAELEKVTTELSEVDKSVKDHQRKLVESNPGTLLAAIIKSSWEVNIPKELEGQDRYLYAKEHWFDNIDFSNPCLLRSPLIHSKTSYYLEKLTPRHPDSIILSIDRILEKSRANEEVFKYHLVTYLNEYAKSKIVGMDAVYVHIAEKYYASGQAPWTEQEQLEKIVDNAEKLKPLLIGKIAPEIKVPELDIEGTLLVKDDENEHKRFKVLAPVSLHEIESPYTIVYIWSPDCGHCKKAMPDVIKFYEEYRDKGVKLYAICHKNYKDTPSCAEFIKERPEMMTWLNLNDPYFRSRYPQLYDVKSTPQVYILDENKEIISKRIGADQLGEVMEQLMKME